MGIIEILVITDPNEAIPQSDDDHAVIWHTWAGTWEFKIGDSLVESTSLAAALDWVSMWVRNRVEDELSGKVSS